MLSLKFKRRFIYPFKWFYQSHIWGFWFRVKYVRLFASAVWHWDCCDYSPTIRLMEIGFREISRLHRDHGHVVDSPKIARETLIASELCRRIQEDEYAVLAGWERYEQMNEHQRQRWAKLTEYLANQDVAFLARLFNRRLRTWWQ